jgi:hypothetical protein
MDRLTVAGSGAFRAEPDTEYLENNCVEEPIKLCEFKKLNGRILKTVDSVYQDVGSADECRELCLNSPFRCHSYDYGDTGEMVCRLSHHSRATLADIQVSLYLLPETPQFPLDVHRACQLWVTNNTFLLMQWLCWRGASAHAVCKNKHKSLFS